MYASNDFQTWNLMGGARPTITPAGLVTASKPSTELSFICTEFAVEPLDEVVFSVYARKVSGPVGQEAELSAGFNGTGAARQVSITSTSWKKYTVRAVAPATLTSPGFCRLSAGLFTGKSGVAEFMNPNVSFTRRKFSSFGTLAGGRINVTSSAATISGNSVATGITAITPNTSGVTITVPKIPIQNRTTVYAGRRGPIVHVSTMGTTNLGVFVKAGSYNADTGEQPFVFVNGSGVAVNNSSLTDSLTFDFEMRV